MTPADLLQALHVASVSVRVHEGRLQVYPAERLTDSLRAALRDQRAGLIALLAQIEQTTADLLAAAAQVCDLYGESDRYRADMQADCLATPAHLRADLLDYFGSVIRRHEQDRTRSFAVDLEVSGFTYGQAANQDRLSGQFAQTARET